MGIGPLAVYPGSFDPPTRGHEDIAKRALSFCDRLVVAVGRNSKKKGLFEVDARVEMLTKVIKSIDPSRIEVTSFEGLLVDFCRKRGASIIVRGLRYVTDFEYELGIAHANAEQAPSIETVFLTTKPSLSFISSSVVREIAAHGGPVSNYVSPPVEEYMRQVFTK